MTMIQLLVLSYASLLLGVVIVALDLRAQGLTTVAALRDHVHVLRVGTVLGASAALVGAMIALAVMMIAMDTDWTIAAAALPACVAFAWAARTITPA